MKSFAAFLATFMATVAQAAPDGVENQVARWSMASLIFFVVIIAALVFLSFQAAHVRPPRRR